MTQKWKRARLPNEHPESLVRHVQGLQAVQVGVLVQNNLQPHISANVGFPHRLITFTSLKFSHKAGELICLLTIFAPFLPQVVLQVEGATYSVVGYCRGEKVPAVNFPPSPGASLDKMSGRYFRVVQRTREPRVPHQSEQGWIGFFHQ